MFAMFTPPVQTAEDKISYIRINSIRPNPYQPRKYFDEASLEELSASIAEHGVIQPVTVRVVGNAYELVAGERRLRAARLAGLKKIPCLIIGAGDQQSSAIALVENMQRRDLDCFEEAEAISRLMITGGFTQEEVASRVGKSQSSIANKLRLMRLGADVIERIRKNRLTERHARALLKLPDDKDRMQALDEIVEKKLNVDASERYIERMLEKRESKEKPPVNRPTPIIKDVRFFLNTLNRALDTVKRSGVNAEFGREEDDRQLRLTIVIPKRRR